MSRKKSIPDVQYTKTPFPNPEQVDRFTESQRTYMKENHFSPTETSRAYLAMMSDLIQDSARRDTLHVFIDDQSLLDFLKSLEVKEIPIDVTKFHERKELSEEDSPFMEYVVMVHFNTKLNENTLIFEIVHLGDDHFHIAHFQLNDFSLPLEGFRLDNLRGLTPSARFCMNIMLYLEAFPESVSEGVPFIYRRYGSMRNTTKVISVHPSISEASGRTVNPHFRCGHFRRLIHERYVNKRGQLVFVRPTFVKGEAKTAYEGPIPIEPIPVP